MKRSWTGSYVTISPGGGEKCRPLVPNRLLLQIHAPRPLDAIENDVRAMEKDILTMLAEVTESGSGDV